MSSRPWYKRYPSDFIAGTINLTFEEKGAYSIILDLLYDKAGEIDDDPQWIGRVLGLSTRKWNVIREGLIKKGKLFVNGGKLSNKRAIIQAKYEEISSENLRKNAEKSADKRAEKKADLLNNNNLEKNRHEHTRSQKPENVLLEKEPKGARAKSVQKPDDIPDQLWNDHLQCRKAKKQPISETALAQMRREAEKLGWTLEQALTEACGRGWASFKAEWVEQKGKTNGNGSYDNELDGWGRAANLHAQQRPARKLDPGPDAEGHASAQRRLPIG